MKKEVFLASLIILFLTPVALAQSIEDPIKKITNSAEQYEVGNINYAQLIVYITSSREELAEEMGAVRGERGTTLKVEQLESALGKPTDSTKWVWIEGEEREKKLDKEIPAWRKVIFDGKKIQIWLNAWPNIVQKNSEDVIFYRLNLDVIFKKPEDQIDITSKIEEIKSIAEKYKSNPNDENLNILAKESVNAEQLFHSYFSQNPEKCEEVMNNLFGSENKREDKKLFAEDIVFYEGSNFETNLRLEMCDDCEWAWININMWFNGRGNFKHPDESINYNQGAKRKFESLSHEEFKKETINLLDQIKNKIAEEDYQSAIDAMQELRILTEVWNDKANNVWQEVEDRYRVDWDSMTDEERTECSKNYCWIKKEQERRIAEKGLKNTNYQDRKEFYLNLFSNYGKKEFYSEQEEWEKRLVEDFKEFGEEICSNNIDDNDNEQVDCSDSQCGGKICGYDTISIEENNATVEQKIELYCISGSCQAKNEIVKKKIAICGNNICEENEQETCATDCATCFEHKALECSGSVIFSGEDEKGCPLEPICLPDQESCNTDDDCTNPLCGSSSCINGICQVTELTECKEPECIDGKEKVQNCESGETLVTEKCIEGSWVKTNIACEVPNHEIQQPIEEEITKEECVVKSDCGNENDVCSNGRCITLPKSVNEDDVKEEIVVPEPIKEEQAEDIEEQKIEETKEQQAEEPEKQEETQEQQPEQDSAITGEVISSLLKSLTKLTGFAAEESSSETAPEAPVNNDNANNEVSNPNDVP
ncbi:hypothetical protein HYT57_05845, partial [Candidatus Woesearchaeota archaeon]|nr:hypothetical protein [Candidatus Woesearchaeota archaeon]